TWSNYFVLDDPKALCQTDLESATGLAVAESGLLTGVPRAGTGSMSYEFCVKVTDGTDLTPGNENYRLFHLKILQPHELP
ncbi:MAG: hypothetical protein ACRDIB_18340, partial [Ardenticatenaceae bacterium]